VSAERLATLQLPSGVFVASSSTSELSSSSVMSARVNHGAGGSDETTGQSARRRSTLNAIISRREDDEASSPALQPKKAARVADAGRAWPPDRGGSGKEGLRVSVQFRGHGSYAKPITPGGFRNSPDSKTQSVNAATPLAKLQWVQVQPWSWSEHTSVFSESGFAGTK